jgi:hypothetical protein
MKYNKELDTLIKNKNFKTFWHCLDYLLLAGYKPLDAFGLTMREFGEDRIYSDVAFIKFNNKAEVNTFTGEINFKRGNFTIGLIDENNIHLSGLYNLYRKSRSDGTMSIGAIEIEETCEIIKAELTPFIVDYLHGVSIKHFGFEAFSLKGDIETWNPLAGESYGRYRSLGVDVANIDDPTAHSFMLYRDNLDENGRPRIVNRPYK